MSEIKHTPLPWFDRGNGGIGDNRDNPIPIYSGWMSEAWYGEDLAKANAALIVRAVNAYDDLVEALQAALEVVNVAETMTSSRGDDDWTWGVQAKINAALSKATGGAA